MGCSMIFAFIFFVAIVWFLYSAYQKQKINEQNNAMFDVEDMKDDDKQLGLFDVEDISKPKPPKFERHPEEPLASLGLSAPPEKNGKVIYYSYSRISIQHDETPLETLARLKYYGILRMDLDEERKIHFIYTTAKGEELDIGYMTDENSFHRMILDFYLKDKDSVLCYLHHMIGSHPYIGLIFWKETKKPSFKTKILGTNKKDPDDREWKLGDWLPDRPGEKLDCDYDEYREKYIISYNQNECGYLDKRTTRKLRDYHEKYLDPNVFYIEEVPISESDYDIFEDKDIDSVTDYYVYIVLR